LNAALWGNRRAAQEPTNVSLQRILFKGSRLGLRAGLLATLLYIDALTLGRPEAA
jgi:hypothetical protein